MFDFSQLSKSTDYVNSLKKSSFTEEILITLQRGISIDGVVIIVSWYC